MNSTFTKILRIILALGLIFFGINKFIQFDFMPPPDLPAQAENFMSSLTATGYVLPIVGALEVLIGLLLLAKKWVPFALVLLAPISVNIVLFHIFLDLPQIGGALVVAILNIILMYKYWRSFKPLFH